MMTPPLSAPGWALAIMAFSTITMQLANIYKPQSFMAEFDIANKSAARFIGELEHSCG